MNKLVFLKFTEGDFQQGFTVTVVIGNDGDQPSSEAIGKLLPDSQLLILFKQWQTSYYRLRTPYRIKAKPGIIKNVSIVEDCQTLATRLCDRFNSWLNSDAFHPIVETFLEQVKPTETVRIILQTQSLEIRQLPWHTWHIFKRYAKAEIALSSTIYTQVSHPKTVHSSVRVLGILGDSTHIDIERDRALFNQLPNADVHFLIEPNRQELNATLWDAKGWDILFFAGHSTSQGADPSSPTSSESTQEGCISINPSEQLTLSQLSYALQKARDRGLRIAIFNSCDGLGLAQVLSELNIPQILVMREPIPDRVAHEFLKYFLEAFSQGESFYLAVRDARERLQGLEHQFPCATWLPVITQNPAETPPTWQSLHCSPAQPQRHREWLKHGILTIAVTAGVIGLRLTGLLQAWELSALDHLQSHRPHETPDRRLTLITITNDDIQRQDTAPRRGSLSDNALEQLLERLDSLNPRVIGLDIYRDFPVEPDQQGLADRLAQTQNLVSICKSSDTSVNDPGIAPPPEIPAQNIGFSDFITDPDGVVRRHLFAMTPEPTSPCLAPYAFSTQLALRYLATEDIPFSWTEDGYLQVGDRTFTSIHSHTGGYQGIDAWGHQILLNYRALPSLEQVGDRITLTEALDGAFDASAIHDKIVLIGTTDRSFGDYWSIPNPTKTDLADQVPGMVMQAHMVSQILSAVQDNRPLLTPWSVRGESLWILVWSLVGGGLSIIVINRGTSRSAPLRFVMGMLTTSGTLWIVCWLVLTQYGLWLPLVPALLSMAGTAISFQVYELATRPSTEIASSKD